MEIKCLVLPTLCHSLVTQTLFDKPGDRANKAVNTVLRVEEVLGWDTQWQV